MTYIIGGCMKESKVSYVWKVFQMMINPAGVLKKLLSDTKWYWSLPVPVLAFMLFFLQTGIDVYRSGQQEFVYLVIMAFVGMLYGLLIIPLLGILVWLILKIGKTSYTALQSVSAICLSYSGALIYGLLGLVFSLVMGWNTALIFGVTGVLWALGPMMYTIRFISGGKRQLSIPLSTLVGVVVLYSWYMIGRGIGA